GAAKAIVAARREAKPRTLNSFMAPRPRNNLSFKHICPLRAPARSRTECRKTSHHDNFSLSVDTRVEHLKRLRKFDLRVGSILQNRDGAVLDPSSGSGGLKRS